MDKWNYRHRTAAAVLKKAGIEISIDGKDAWRDNVFVERLWRSIKYEEVYLHTYKTVSEACDGIGRYLAFKIPDVHIHLLTSSRRIRLTSTR